MKTLLLLFALSFVFLQTTYSQWNIQKINNEEVNSKISAFNHFIGYEESTSSLNYLIITDFAYIVSFNANNTDVQTFKKLNIDASTILSFIDGSNRLIRVISFNETLYFVCKNSIYTYKQDILSKASIGDKYDRDSLMIPSTELQFQRNFNLVFPSNGKLYFSCQSNDIEKTELYKNAPVQAIQQDYFELFEFNNNKFNLLFKSSEGLKSIYTLNPKIVQTYKNGFLLGNFKYKTNPVYSSLCYLADNKITNLEEHPQFTNSFNYNICVDLFTSTTNKTYALYCGDFVQETKTFYKPSVVVYENEKPVDLFLLSNFFGSVLGPERKFHSYKDNFFVSTEAGLYYYNGKVTTLLPIPFCDNQGKQEIYGKTFINDKGIFILQHSPQKGLVYYKNTDELIAATGIEEVNSEDYYSILGNEIKFQKLPESYMVYDLNGKAILENSKPNQIEKLPTLTTGTYFIFAQYGKQLIKNKFLIQN